MYVLIWRYNKSSPWYVSGKLLPSEQDVRAEINSMVRYDVGGRREYRWASIGDVDTWHDPFAEQKARDERLQAVRRQCDCGGPFVGKSESYHLPTCSIIRKE